MSSVWLNNSAQQRNILTSYKVMSDFFVVVFAVTVWVSEWWVSLEFIRNLAAIHISFSALFSAVDDESFSRHASLASNSCVWFLSSCCCTSFVVSALLQVCNMHVVWLEWSRFQLYVAEEFHRVWSMCLTHHMSVMFRALQWRGSHHSVRPVWEVCTVAYTQGPIALHAVCDIWIQGSISVWILLWQDQVWISGWTLATSLFLFLCSLPLLIGDSIKNM